MKKRIRNKMMNNPGRYKLHQYLKYAHQWADTVSNFPVIAKENAFKAVAMAQEEMKRKAIETLSSVLENWIHGGDADCIIAEFEEKLK